MLSLDCNVQQYAWGKNGNESKVALIKSSFDSSFKVNQSESYAELWMGTHPSGPSKIFNTNQPLKEWISSHPTAVGVVPSSYSNDDLPFLFKVLSIKTALSIQAHPDKSLAKELNEKFPTIYKDGNHKPEMAVALTNFEALCGFRNPSEIIKYFDEYPELAGLITTAVVNDFKELSSSNDLEVQREAYRKLFYSFMSTSDEIANSLISQLISRLSNLPHLNTINDVIIRLNKDYPNDRGIFCPLILNYLTLLPGESFFMGPNEPHAYLSGDCVECMALSDNVVRAGLTPKFKDVDTLCKMLHYRYGNPSKLPPIKLDENTILYRPPVDLCSEFEVELTTLKPNESYDLITIPSASIIIFTEGDVESDLYDKSNEQHLSVKFGSIVFITANAKITLSSKSSSVSFYRAHINLTNI